MTGASTSDNSFPVDLRAVVDAKLISDRRFNDVSLGFGETSLLATMRLQF